MKKDIRKIARKLMDSPYLKAREKQCLDRIQSEFGVKVSKDQKAFVELCTKIVVIKGALNGLKMTSKKKGFPKIERFKGGIGIQFF